MRNPCIVFFTENNDHSHEPIVQTYTDSQLENLIDSSLVQMDKNHDGYVDFPEYRAAHKLLQQ